jgi:site-specific recombinase
LSFVIVMLLHWTVATKQPAMTAPALAASACPRAAMPATPTLEAFVDRVAQLIRSQAAGIVGNLALCGPLVLAQVQGWPGSAGRTPGRREGSAVRAAQPDAAGAHGAVAAFTGVLLFASSLIAGWAENWFVFHRLDSAIAWNPRIVARLGAARARRWALWWRTNVSGVAANVSLGMMLGLVPAVLAIGPAAGGAPRHAVHGPAGAALGALGLGSCWPARLLVVRGRGIAFTGVLNVGSASGWPSRWRCARAGVRLHDRSRIGQALRQRLLSHPLSFMLAAARAEHARRVVSGGLRRLPAVGPRTWSTRR